MKIFIFIVLFCAIAAVTPQDSTAASTSTDKTFGPQADPAPSSVPASAPASASASAPASAPASASTSNTSTNASHTNTTALLTTAQATTFQPIFEPETINGYVFAANETIVCLKANFSVHFEQNKTIWNVSSDAAINNETSSCGVLSVTFAHGKFEIDFSQDNGRFFMLRVSVALPDINATSENGTWARASNGSSYMCKSGITIGLTENVTMVMKNVQLQAFYIKEGEYGTAEKCNDDLSPLVPIIVGAILAALVLVVLVAYIIGRKRNRTGYEEI